MRENTYIQKNSTIDRIAGEAEVPKKGVGGVGQGGVGVDLN